MVTRPIWTGQIRLSLVSIPVKLFSATQSAAKLSFNQIHEPTGKRIRYEKVVPGIGPVDSDDIVMGYQFKKGSYVTLTDEELDAVKIEAKKTVELVQFFDVCEIDPIYFDRPYYVVPDGELAEEAFTVVRDALRATGKVGLGQIVMRGREYIVALKPCNRGMMIETLRFEEELRKSDSYFSEIGSAKADKDLMGLAQELIGKKSKPFDPSAFSDHYTDAVHELIRKKQRGKSVIDSDEEGGSENKGAEIIDLMAALKKSLGAKAGGTAKATPAKRKPAAKPAPRRSKAPRRRSKAA
jgi:DNA end-binding protein Ku